MAYENYKTCLKRIAPLTEDDCALFEPKLKTTILAKNEFWLLEGYVCKEIGFIESGLFRQFYIQEGKEINIHFHFENDFLVSYQSFLKQEPSRYYIEALEDAEIITFNYQCLKDIYARSHTWERFGRIMAETSYMMATQRTESFLFMTGEQRYLQLLEQHPHIFNRLPLYHIASYLGIERESLSRLRKKIFKS